MSFFQSVLFAALLLLTLPAGPAGAQEQPSVAGLPQKARDVSSIYIDAVKARMLDDARQEEALLKEVIRLNPSEAAPYHDLARLYQRQRKTEQAEEHIRKAIARDSTNNWYQVALAEILEAQNKTEEAASVYTRLVRREKFNREYIFHAARLYEASGKYKEAITLLDQLMGKGGNEDFLLMQQQQLYLKLNDVPGAVAIARRLIERNPEEGRYYALLAELYNSNGQPEKALEIYQDAISRFPADASLQYGLAQYYKSKGDTARYDTYIRKAILNRDFDDETQMTILFNYLQELAADSARKREGTEITRELAALHPGDPRVIYLYGEVLLGDGQPEQATEQFKKAVTLDPSRFNAWQRLLFSYTDRKDADSLVLYSEKAMRYFPNQAIVHFLNGIGHFNRQTYDRAARSIKRAIDLQPEDNKELLADMYAQLGDVYNAAGRHSASDSSYEKALQLNPGNPTVLNNYAYYLSVRGVRLGNAERMSARSLELRPDEATFLDTYGWILYKQGQYQKAKTYIDKALEKNPNADGTLWEHLGDIHYKLGDKAKAVELWMKAKEKGTENKEIDKKIEDKKLYE